MEYKILQAEKPHALQEAVQKEIEKGWIPQGGPAAVNKSIVKNNELIYIQALIKG